jgi:hypothetical protein
MLNPERVILNLIQNLFRAGLFLNLINQTLKRVQGDKNQLQQIVVNNYRHKAFLPISFR